MSKRGMEWETERSWSWEDRPLRGTGMDNVWGKDC